MTNSKYTATVGRVKRWLQNPTKIYPVSCTMVAVEDTYFDMDDDDDDESQYSQYETITGSRTFVTMALKHNAGVAVDLSKLRPSGSVGSNELVAQGPTNFMAVYSAINREVRRGNSFRNGAVALFLDFDHPDFEEFINIPVSEIPWAKRSVYVDDNMWKPEYKDRRQQLYKALADGTVFVGKKQYGRNGERLYSQICMEVLIKSRGRCILQHVNLGQIEKPEDLLDAFNESMQSLVSLWNQLPDHPLYLPKEQDNQIGLGVLGLANMLSHFNVTYQEFVDALKRVVRDYDLTLDSVAKELAVYLVMGYELAAKEAREAGLDRAFVIAPCATVSFAYTDINGYVCTPEISPPVCHPTTKMTRRISDDGFKDYQYPPNVEVAGYDVGVEVYDELAKLFQEIMDDTGLAHSISYNWWTTKQVNEDTFKQWYDSPLKTIYYRWNVLTSDQDKSTIRMDVSAEEEAFWENTDEQAVTCGLSTGECVSCAE